MPCVLPVLHYSPASENVGETKCSLDFATRARKVELGAALKVPEWSGGGVCNSPSAGGGRDSPLPVTGRSSQLSTAGSGANGSSNSGGGSAASSPRVNPRYSSTEGYLRQTVSRRAAATSQKDDK